MSPLDADADFVDTMHGKAQSIAAILRTKKCSVKLIDKVLRQCVFPQLAYPCQFAAVSTKDLYRIGGPIRAAIADLIEGSSLSNDVMFAGDGLPYGLPLTDFADHVNRAKAGMVARLNVSSEILRLTLQSLLNRGRSRLSDKQSPSVDLMICPSAKETKPMRNPSCWALSYIEHVQESQVEVYLPATHNLPRQHSAPSLSRGPFTHTPLTQVVIPDTDGISVEEVQDFAETYHICFVEELFPEQPIPPTGIPEHISSLQELFDAKYKPFIARVVQAYSNSSLSLGVIILRPHMCIDTRLGSHGAREAPTMIEGVIDSPLYPDPHVAYRPWILNKDDPAQKQIICAKGILEAPASLASLNLSQMTTRRLYTLPNFDPTTAYHKSYALKQRILLPALTNLDLSAPAPTLQVTFPSDLLATWAAISSESQVATIYTDGSCSQRITLPTYLHPSPPLVHLSSSIVLVHPHPPDTPWHMRDVSIY
jgi:hypothetical protein